MKKKILALMMALAMVLCFTACGSSDEPASTPSDADGGWTANLDVVGSDLPDDLNSYFNAAVDSYNENVGDGTTFEPVTLMGTLADSGTQYCFFCKSSDEEVPFKIMTFAVDESGNVGFVTISDFDIADYTSDNPPVTDDGEIKWQVYLDQPFATMPEDVKIAFDGVFDDSSDVTPVAYLGSQVVAGTNYAILCAANIASAENEAVEQVIVINEDPDGNYSVVSTYNIDMSQY